MARQDPESVCAFRHSHEACAARNRPDIADRASRCATSRRDRDRQWPSGGDARREL